MAALWIGAGHYIFCPVSTSFFYPSWFFPRLVSAVADWMSTILPHLVWPLVWIYNACLKCTARGSLKIHDAKNLGTIAQLSSCVFAPKACIDNRKKLLNSNTSSTCPRNMVNFGLLTAEICWRVWGTPANLNGFRVLAALLHGTIVVGVSKTLQRWTESATCIRQGGYHVEHWPTF